MQLINKPECPFCWKVRLALAECDLDYENLDSQTDSAQALLEHHSMSNTVPVLLDDDCIITDSTVALEYIEEAYGQGQLLPKSVKARTKARSIEHYSNNIVGRSLREVIFEKRDNPELDWNWPRIEQGEKGWRTSLDQLTAWLEPTGFFASQFSYAECALIARFALADRYGVAVDDRHPQLKDWFEAMKARPSYTQADAW